MRGDGLPGIESLRKTTDGGYLAGGSYYWLRQIQPFLTKIRPNGSVEWTRGYLHQIDEGTVQRVVASSDGGSFISTSNTDHLDDHHQAEYSTLMKVDENGNLLWNKRFEEGTGRYKIQAVIATNDGGCIFTFNINDASASSDRSFVIRFDAGGNTIWQKSIDGGPATFLGYRELLLDGNDLYLGINAHWGSEYVKVEKWNAATGNFIWGRAIGAGNPGIVDVQGVYKIKDTLYMGFITRDPASIWGWESKLHFVKFLPDGRLFDGFQLRNPAFLQSFLQTQINGDVSPYIAKTNDDAFIIAQQIRAATDFGVGVVKISPQGTVIWSRNFKNLTRHAVSGIVADGDNILIIGTNQILQPISTETRRDHSFIMKLNKNGDVIENATGNCSNETLAAAIDPFQIAPPDNDQPPVFGNGGVI
ncbi:MAG: hypothetical protein EOP49_40010, partial [Sphingobacteriales bacterium]